MKAKEYIDLMGSVKAKRNKYGAVRTRGYASRKESRRAAELEYMERAGLISDLRQQVKYVLIGAQRTPEGVYVAPCSYVADFVYVKDGETVVEDVKGVRTPVYRIKYKLMLERHGIVVREV